MTAHRILAGTLAGIALFTPALQSIAKSMPDNNLRVVFIRHGEKPDAGDNLSCQGENRALQLPAVLYGKYKIPDYTYVPSLGLDESTKHARMFQTVTPFAVKYNLTVNSQFDEKDYSNVAEDVENRSGTVLLVWEHSAIPHLAKKMGVANPPDWKGDDFDSIWVITFADGVASLSVDREGLTPSADCRF